MHLRLVVSVCVYLCLSFLDVFQWGQSQYIKFFQIAAAPFPLLPPGFFKRQRAGGREMRGEGEVQRERERGSRVLSGRGKVKDGDMDSSQNVKRGEEVRRRTGER